MKPIRLSNHAEEQLAYRGVLRSEVVDAIENSDWSPARGGKLECSIEYEYGRLWNDKLFATKRVRPIFVEEADEIVVVTVYSYYY